MNKENINFVIFDMDGVLVDSELAITLASMESLSEWGVAAKEEDFKEFTGMGDDKFIGGVAGKYGVAYDLKMKARAYEIYLEKAEERVQVFAWSKPLIEKLHAAGYKLAVASASDYVKVKRNIECIGVSPDIFDAVVTGSDVERKKPFPDIFLKAFEKVKSNCGDADLDVSRTLVCEDALSGVIAARAAGMHCAAVTTSFAAEALAEAGAHYVTDDLMTVTEIFGQK
jgi:haloacid dehalogenase superfamily, subfamily IA, variant 3 with third motif having DD or ED